MQLRHDIGGLGHRVDHVIGERCGVRAGETYALKPGNLTARAQKLGKRAAVTELHAVGVHVLAEQGDFYRAGIHERLHLGQDVPGAAVFFLTAQLGNNAERARVVAAHGDGHPPGIGLFAFGGQG